MGGSSCFTVRNWLKRMFLNTHVPILQLLTPILLQAFSPTRTWLEFVSVILTCSAGNATEDSQELKVKISESISILWKKGCFDLSKDALNTLSSYGFTPEKIYNDLNGDDERFLYAWTEFLLHYEAVDNEFHTLITNENSTWSWKLNPKLHEVIQRKAKTDTKLYSNLKMMQIII